ncbi:MAG: tetratricopeptide repeat protein [Bacteroidetes bacterium]|nr:tetratricopeptide repeat protein [Bacteroidota bacterium]
MQSNSPDTAPDIRSLERHLALHPTSPLFTRLAEYHITANRPAQALKICLQGMRYYPDYSTALLLIARAQVMLRQYSDARETVHELLRIQPGCPAALRLLNRMTELELEYPPYTASAGSRFVQSGLSRESGAEQPEKWSRQDDIMPTFETRMRSSGHGAMTGSTEADQAPDAGAPAGKDKAETSPSFDLSGLASRLEHARIPPLPEPEEGDAVRQQNDDGGIETVNLDARPVTETLIEIYIQQGKLREALDACHRLAERRPDRAEELSRKIRDLKQRLDDAAFRGGESF